MDNLVHEITNVLREWGHHWKHLYVVYIYIIICTFDIHLIKSRDT